MSNKLTVDSIQDINGKNLYSQTNSSATIGDATVAGTSFTIPSKYPTPPADYSNSELNPTVIFPHTDGHFYIEGVTQGGDVDYVSFKVGSQNITSFYLSYYQSVDPVAFFAIQEGRQFTAGQNIALMLDYGHFGPTTTRPVGANILGSNRILLANTFYTIWIQQLGVPTTYAFSTNPVYQGRANSVVDTFQNLTVGNKLTVSKIKVNTRIQLGNDTRAVMDLGAATDAILLPKGTAAQRPSVTENGLIRYNSQTNKVEGFVNSSWKDINYQYNGIGGSSGNPASSATAILSADPTAPNGTYWLNHGSGAYQVYCDMTAGGYILVGKIASTSSNNTAWAYNGSNWSATSPVNESGCANIESGDSLNRGYYEYTTTTGFIFSLGSAANYLTATRSGVTAKNAFTGAQFNMDGMSRSQFMSWITAGGISSSNFDNQPNCNRIGFNRTDSSSSAMRFGITMNNEGDCNSNDSAIGFGTYTNNDTGGIRNIPAGGHRWNPDQKLPSQGYIFVK